MIAPSTSSEARCGFSSEIPMESVSKTEVSIAKLSVNEMVLNPQASPDANLPEFVREILSELSDPESRRRLQSFLHDTFETVQLHQSHSLTAQAETSELKERLDRVELELRDVRSAAALMVAGQEEVMSTLKRRYEEELASLHSISQHQFADLEAVSQKEFQRERNRLTTERNALLPGFETHRGTISYVSQRLPTPDSSTTNQHCLHSQQPIPSDTDLTSKSERISASRPDMNLPPRGFRGIDGSTNNGEPDYNSFVKKVGQHSSGADATYITRYENEIARLRRMLEDSVLNNYPETQGEGESPTSNSFRESSLANCRTASPSELRVVWRASQTESPDFLADEPQSTILEPATGPITEASWLHLQGRSKDTDERPLPRCIMCSNYEHQLQTLQSHQQVMDQNLRELAQELTTKSAQLAVILQNQADLEIELKSRTVAQAKRLETLETLINRFSIRLEDILSNYRAHRTNTEKELRLLTVERENLRTDIGLLQSHYDSLIGRRSKAAAELSEQPIHLPSDKTELELLALKLYEENLSLRAAREHLDERLQCEAQFSQQQLNAERAEWENMENALHRELDDTKARLASLSDVVGQLEKEVVARLKAEEESKSLRSQMEEVQAKLNQAESEAAELRAEVTKFQQRMLCLQADLDNAESVQADFVRLSQNLQVQLERFRQQEHELRWVDPDDVATCFACNTTFSSGRGSGRKINCRHCGKVHCQNCIKNTVVSGPMGRPAQVCDVCHTLLNKHVAPYFSTGFSDIVLGTQLGNASPRSRHDSSSTAQSPSSVTLRNKS